MQLRQHQSMVPCESTTPLYGDNSDLLVVPAVSFVQSPWKDVSVGMTNTVWLVPSPSLAVPSHRIPCPLSSLFLLVLQQLAMAVILHEGAAGKAELDLTLRSTAASPDSPKDPAGFGVSCPPNLLLLLTKHPGLTISFPLAPPNSRLLFHPV